MNKISSIMIILFFIIPLVTGIEVDFSMNDLDLNTQYDVDDSVYVYEEASGDPLLTTIRDYREVYGNGKINLKQGFSSHNYAATSGVKADSGSVQSAAIFSSTDLTANQRSNLAGSLAESFLTGYQDYMGGMAFTGQYLGVENGILSTVQTLSLGRGIYSTQDFQASGVNPLAIGYALVASRGFNSFDAQGAFILAGAFREGSISGSMGAEVVKVPDATAIDPIAFGSKIDTQGDGGAGVIAGAGALKGSWSQNQFANFIGLDGQGALAGAVGIGKNSRASVDYIQAQTDGQESSAFELNAKAKGDDAAIVAAGAGNFKRNAGFGFGPNSFLAANLFDMQGAIAAAAGVGDDSEAEASLIGAITDGTATYAGGYRLRAKADGFAGLGAAAGSLYMDRRFMQSPFFFVGFDSLGLQGALALAVAEGDDSQASANSVDAFTDGDTTFAEGYRMRASGDDFAGVGAGAGNFYMDSRLMQSPFFSGSLESLGVQGALALAVAGGEDSRASANYVGALTDGDITFAEGHRIRASGDDFAGLGAGAGSYYMSHGLVQSPLFFADFGGLDMQGALTVAVAGGEDSRASANYVGALTDGDTTFAEGYRMRASGDDFAGVGAGAGSFYMSQGIMQSPFFSGIFGSMTMQGALAGAAAGGEDSRASANYVVALTDGDTTFAEGYRMRASGDDFAGLGAGAGSFYMSKGILQSPFFSGSLESLGAQGALALAAAGGEDSRASANYVGALTNGDTTFAEGYRMRASGNEFAATGAGAISIRKEDININPAVSYDYEDTQGSIVADVGMGKDSSASAGYLRAETDGERTSAIGVNLAARGKTSAHAVAGAGEGISLDNGVLNIDQGSATGLNALDNGAVSATLMSAETGDVTQTYGIEMQATGDYSALSYTASGDELAIWADYIRVKDGTLVGLAAKGTQSHVQSGILSSSRTDVLLTSQGSGLIAQGDGAIAATASGDVINFGPDAAKVESGSLTGAAAYGDASVTSNGLASFWSPASTLSIGETLAANGGKSAVLATGKGEKVTIKADENEGRARVDQGTIAGVTAYQNAHVSGEELVSGDIELAVGPILMDGEGSYGQGLSGSGEKSAAIATGSGDSVAIVADEDKGRAKADQGSVVGATAYKNAQVGSNLLASGEMQVAVGTEMMDVAGSAGLGLSASGEKSASLAAGAGDSVLTDADKNRGIAKVEKGTVTGVTAHKNAQVAGGLLASGDIKLNINPLVLDGLGSIGTGLSGSGDDSASGASGFGEEAFAKANGQMGEAKVTNGGIAGMAAHENGQVSADLMGSAGLTDGTVAGWIGLNPSATGTMTALGTGFGSEVNIEADAAIVETNTGSIIGLTASGPNSRTSADSIVGYETAAVPTLYAENVLAQGDSASAGSATGLSASIASNKITVNTGTVVGMAAKGGQVQADSLEFSSLTPSGTNLKASGTSASMASAAVGPLSTASIESNKISVGVGTVVGMAANGPGSQVESQTLGFSSALPSATYLKASGSAASAASATGASTVIESNKVSVNAGSVVGMVSSGGQVQADALGSTNLMPSGTNLKASGTTASAASTTGVTSTIESNKISVNAGNVVGMVAAGGQVEAAGLGFSSLYTSGTTLAASGTTASAASATSLLSTATIESNKISVNAGSVVGMVAAGGQVSASTLGFTGIYPSGTTIAASGTSATSASATGLGTTTLESNKVTVNTGSMVGLAVQEGQVTAGSLGYDGASSIGSGLAASGSKSMIAAGAGNKITLKPDSTKIESTTLDPNGVLLALAAGGSSQLNADILEASKGLTTSVAKGSGLSAYGQDYSEIAAASSGSLAGGTIINFQPSSGTNPYYGMSISDRGAYGGARTSGGTVTANQLMAKSDITSLTNTNYIVGGPNAGPSAKDYATMQAVGTSPVVFAAFKPTSLINPNPSVTTKMDEASHTIWAYRNTAGGNKEAN